MVRYDFTTSNLKAIQEFSSNFPDHKFKHTDIWVRNKALYVINFFTKQQQNKIYKQKLFESISSLIIVF